MVSVTCSDTYVVGVDVGYADDEVLRPEDFDGVRTFESAGKRAIDFG